MSTIICVSLSKFPLYHYASLDSCLSSAESFHSLSIFCLLPAAMTILPLDFSSAYISIFWAKLFFFLSLYGVVVISISHMKSTIFVVSQLLVWMSFSCCTSITNPIIPNHCLFLFLTFVLVPRISIYLLSDLVSII